MGEFERIARLSARFGRLAPPAIGIGDDAAVVPTSGASLVLTVDASVEGVHFTRDIISLDQAADRAVEAAISDVAAMGGAIAWDGRSGCGLLAAITAPRTLDEWDFDALIDGFARAAERRGAKVLGGNLAAAPVISITTTAIGRIHGPPLVRSGAKPGDALYVTGTIGAAALGLRALGAHAGDEPRFAPFVQAWRAPRARLGEGAALVGIASAAIDVSDGLAQDAGHIAEASNCGVVIDLDRLPMRPGQREAADSMGLDAVVLALTGGEDYELCFTARDAPIAPAGSAGWTVIGEVIASRGVFVRDAKGTRPFASHGWDHF